MNGYINIEMKKKKFKLYDKYKFCWKICINVFYYYFELLFNNDI